MKDRAELLKELAEIEAAMTKFLLKASGFHVQDFGELPDAIVQSRNRFYEAVMWAKRFIEE